MPRLAAIELPPGCRTLSDEDADRLDKVHPSSWKTPHKGCKTCQDRRFYLAPNGQEYDCDCRTQWKMHRWLLNAGIGDAYQRLDWADATAVNGNATLRVVDYLEGAPNVLNAGLGLTLWASDRGTGKTLMAILLLKAVMAEHGTDGYFIQFNDLLDIATDGWRNAEERRWFTRRIRNVDLLVVDDIGRENHGGSYQTHDAKSGTAGQRGSRSGMIESLMDQVLRHRTASRKPTIITTNFSPDEMHGKYGKNVLSLLSEVNEEVHFPGADWREQSKARLRNEVRNGITRPIVARSL